MASKKRTFLGEITANRGVSTELTPEQITAILSALAEGKGPCEISRETGIHRSTIYRKKKQWLAEGRLTASPRSGRPRYFDDRSIRQLKLFVLRDGRSSYSDIRNNLGIDASDDTIRAALKSIYVNHWLAVRRIPLSEEDEKLRYHWAKLWRRDTERLLRVSGLKFGPKCFVLRALHSLCSFL
jgi:transposase